MYFSNLIITSLLALTTLVTSQVVVTVTNTITVITVTATATYTPPTTSTSTVFVTISAPPPPTRTTSASTSTRTVTVTATASSPTITVAPVCPLGVGGSCGLWNPDPNGCTVCGRGLSCRSVIWSSSRCENAGPTVITLTSTLYRV